MDLEVAFFPVTACLQQPMGEILSLDIGSPASAGARTRPMAVMMTGQRVGMVVRPPTGGGLPAVEGWGGRCAPRHLAQAGGNAGDIGRPADEIRRKVVMSSSFNVSLHRRPGCRPAHGGISSEPPVSGNRTEEDDAAPPVRRAAGGGGVPESGLITLPETPLNSAGQPRERAPPRDEATRQGGHRSPVPST